MKQKQSRRTFVTRVCAACCFLSPGTGLLAAMGPGKEIDPEEFTYCGYRCQPNCDLLKASEAGDTEKKRQVFEEWGTREKYGIEFDADEYFCFGCKNEDKPRGFPPRNCTILPCARDKGYQACFQCQELAECGKELWERYPEHRKYVLELQKTYFATR